MLYPQNGDRVLTVDSVQSLHPVYKPAVCCDDLWLGILLIIGLGVALGVALGVVLLFGLLYCFRR